MAEDLSKYNPDGSTLRKAQLRMLDILKEVDQICRKHNIPYFLESGTLLGAVRHGGFIPWDDDVDITIMRKDYPRLRQYLKEELPDTFVLQDTKSDPNYPMLLAKVRDTKSYFEEEYTDNLKYKGIYIDIFTLEKVPCWKWKQFLDYVYGHCVRSMHHYYSKKDKIFSSIFFPFVWVMVAITRAINYIIPSTKYSYEYGRKTYVRYDIRDIFPLREIQFESGTFFVPKNYDALLKVCYGDYMQIPPQEKRVVHSNKIEFYD